MIATGVPAGALAERRVLPTGQRTAWYAGAVGEPASWLARAVRRPAVGVLERDLPVLAQEHPDDLVLVGRVKCVAGEARRDYRFERATAVAGDPPNTDACS